MPTKIEWVKNQDGTKGETWNPVTGCTKVSPGCEYCYAERMAKRLAGRCGYPADEPFRVTLHSERLEEPLRWRKPRVVFVCSMGDLFHQDVPFEFIDDVFETIANAPQHIFQILTKRSRRMMVYMLDMGARLRYRGVMVDDVLPNVWLGVSAENQQAADQRIPFLMSAPAAIRFVSAEPLLGEIDLSRGLERGLDWLIVGGESGPGARPMHPDWVRSIRDQCVNAGVPFFFKQWGEWAPAAHFDARGHYRYHLFEGHVMARAGKKATGRTLDGREWDEMP